MRFIPVLAFFGVVAISQIYPLVKLLVKLEKYFQENNLINFLHSKLFYAVSF